MIVLGVVEGLTEFLPISSTGHLIVTTELLGQESANGVAEIVIQFGAVLAVLWFYRGDLTARVRALTSDDRQLGFWRNLVVAAVPAAILGFAFGDLITSYLFSPAVVAAAMIGGGVVLWLVERSKPYGDEASRVTSLDRVSVRQALVIGVIQLAALVPGTSRSASSIVGGLLVGLDRPTATAFSFYLAIPTLGGATLYSLVKNIDTLQARGDLVALATGTLAAFVTAAFAIRWMLGYVAHHDFRVFAAYRIVAGLLILLVFRP
jgi:undecaprenyl-diphosphatase